MKLLHTSDWHLGHTLYDFDRAEEQGDMLRQIAEIVSIEKPDVMLLCGDVYHIGQPSAASNRLLAEAMALIHGSHPEMKIIMTAGNHDSASRHEAFDPLWREFNVYAIGNIARETPQSHIIEINGKGWVIAMPYVHPRNLPDSFVADLLNEVRDKNKSCLPVVVTAHSAIKGSDWAGHDSIRPDIIGGIDIMDIGDIGDPSLYDYLALGHIHRAQTLRSPLVTARYSGSPLAVSFDEDYPHSVSIVEIEKRGIKPQIKEIEIKNKRELVNLPPHGFASWEEVMDQLKMFPSDIDAYVRLNVLVDGLLPQGARKMAEDVISDKTCKLCHINPRRNVEARQRGEVMTVEEFRAEKPLEIARRFVEYKGFEFSEDMEKLFMEIEKMIKNNENS